MNANETLGAREEFLTFRLGQEEYAIDILQVREIRAHEPVTRIADAADFVMGVINLRGVIVPILDLRMKFKLPRGVDASTVVIILSIEERLTGVVVDAVSDVMSLLPEQIRPAPQLHGSIDSSFIRGIAPVEGRMLIVADIAALLLAPGLEPEALAA
ncbi:MAG TPA: chemotaxis protein CheW [Usitatibacter sp.]|nr:chemotaxis protein CheW [Usitatibacter sp.]